MTRSLLGLLAVVLPLLCASTASAIKWNDIAVGTNDGSVFSLNRSDLTDKNNPRIGTGDAVADVGFQTAGTPQPPGTPAGTWPPGNSLESVIDITVSGVLTIANAERLGDKIAFVHNTGLAGSDLTVFGDNDSSNDDQVFLGASNGAAEVRDTGGAAALTGWPKTLGTAVIDSVWQKLPADQVAVVDNASGGSLSLFSSDGTAGPTADISANGLPLDVDVYRQDPTLVVASGTNTVTSYDGLTLSQIDTASISLGTKSIVAISVLSTDEVVVAASDGISSELVFLNPDLTVAGGAGLGAIDITAMDNQNVWDHIVIGTSAGEVRLIDIDTSTSGASTIASRFLGQGAITAITVNAPEPASAALAMVSLAALGIRRRVV